MNPSESSDRPGAASGRSNETPSYSKLLLICHGEDMQDRYSSLGNLNSGLTAKGWAEVEVLGQWLSAHESISALYSGPLLQCRLTAQRIGQAVHLPVSMLREPILLASSKHPGLQVEQNGASETVLASATDGAGEETASPMQDILDENSSGTVVLVTSANSIRESLRRLLGANDTQIVLDHTSVTGLQVQDQIWTIAYVNRREHLPVPALPPPEEAHQPVEDAELVEDMASVIAVYDRVAREDVAPKANDDRERISGLLEFASLPEDMDVLDAGAGLGVLALMLAEKGAQSVIGVDISTGMLEQAEYLRLSHPTDTTSRVSYRLGSLQALPFPGERFDAVTCRLLLNHFHSPHKIVHECVRVLRPGGIFLMAELLSVDDPVKRATQNAIEERRNPAHVAARSAEQYDKLITDAGLTIEETASVSITRDLTEWLSSYHTPDAISAVVVEMVEAGLETDAAGIGARRRGDGIEFVQRMYYLKASKTLE